jgi:hypothetical protein
VESKWSLTGSVGEYKIQTKRHPKGDK